MQGDATGDEEARNGDAINCIGLNTAFLPCLAELVSDDALLRHLKFTTLMEYNQGTNVPLNMIHFGSRPFSIVVATVHL